MAEVRSTELLSSSAAAASKSAVRPSNAALVALAASKTCSPNRRLRATRRPAAVPSSISGSIMAVSSSAIASSVGAISSMVSSVGAISSIASSVGAISSIISVAIGDGSAMASSITSSVGAISLISVGCAAGSSAAGSCPPPQATSARANRINRNIELLLNSANMLFLLFVLFRSCDLTGGTRCGVGPMCHGGCIHVMLMLVDRVRTDGGGALISFVMPNCFTPPSFGRSSPRRCTDRRRCRVGPRRVRAARSRCGRR